MLAYLRGVMLLSLFASLIAFTGCADNGSGEEAGETIQEGAEETGEAIQEGAEETGEAVEEGAEETGEAVEDATN